MFFAVPILNQWLFHAPLHGTTALLNTSALAALRGKPGGADADSIAQLASVLRSDPEYASESEKGSLKPKFLGLITTRSCNLRCVYCGFDASRCSSQSLDLDMAVRMIDWLAAVLKESSAKTLNVHFFGGEPTVHWDAIEVAIHRTRMIAAELGLNPHFEISTNGLFDEASALFIGDYFDTVVLSFDGPADLQDRYRPKSRNAGSFETVDRTASILSDSPTELCMRVCVTQESVRRLTELAGWFCDRYRPSVINFEPLQVTPYSEEAGLTVPDPYEFGVAFLCARRQLRNRGVSVVYSADHVDSPSISFCPVGYDTLILSPDGRLSSCYLPEQDWIQRGLDLNVGRIDGERVEIDMASIHRLRRLVHEKPRCRNCFCQWSCGGGCHVNHTYPGCEPEYSAFCIQTRIINACSILESLHEDRLMEELLNNPSGLRDLGSRASDRLEDVTIANVS